MTGIMNTQQLLDIKPSSAWKYPKDARRAYGLVKRSGRKVNGKGSFVNMSMVFDWVGSGLSLEKFWEQKND